MKNFIGSLRNSTDINWVYKNINIYKKIKWGACIKGVKEVTNILYVALYMLLLYKFKGGKSERKNDEVSNLLSMEREIYWIIIRDRMKISTDDPLRHNVLVW